MKVIDMIRLIDEIIDNMISNNTKVIYINELEQQFYQDVVKELELVNVDLVNEQAEYPLYNHYLYEDILKVTVYDNQYSKTTAMNKTANEYYKTPGGLSLIPVPYIDQVDGMEVIYRKKPVEKSVDDINTDTCTILDDFGLRWTPLYENFLKWKISVDLKEFAEANNWAILFEEEKAKFFEWYESTQPEMLNDYVDRGW